LHDLLCGVMFISLSLGRKRNEPKRKAAGCISEAKNRMIFPKTAKRPPLRSGWTRPFLHGEITRFSLRLSEEAGVFPPLSPYLMSRIIY
jgi:hypothetical protein